MTRRRRLFLLISFLAVFLVAAALGRVAAGLPKGWLPGPLAWPLWTRADERTDGYFTLVDERGAPLLRTAIMVRRGDLFIDADDAEHRVITVSGDLARTVLVAPAGAGSSSEPDRTAPAVEAIPLGTASQLVLIYHTHSDESYIPSDGTASIAGAGGIYDVGRSLSSALTVAGFAVIHDTTAHDPHDNGAYLRSRRTVLRNLSAGPTLIFDVHRDSAPVEQYATTIDDAETARILIVIGGANPLYGSNLGVARQMKSLADALYPGLVRGIYVARGSYNQDLSPANILLEMGTQDLPKEAAQRAAVLWANVVSAYLGPPGPNPPPTGGG